MAITVKGRANQSYLCSFEDALAVEGNSSVAVTILDNGVMVYQWEGEVEDEESESGTSMQYVTQVIHPGQDTVLEMLSDEPLVVSEGVN